MTYTQDQLNQIVASAVSAGTSAAVSEACGQSRADGETIGALRTQVANLNAQLKTTMDELDAVKQPEGITQGIVGEPANANEEKKTT